MSVHTAQQVPCPTDEDWGVQADRASAENDRLGHAQGSLRSRSPPWAWSMATSVRRHYTRCGNASWETMRSRSPPPTFLVFFL